MLCKAFAYHAASLGLASYDGTGPSGATSGYVVEPPPSPDDMICVIPNEGFPVDDLSGYQTPEMQVIVRTASDAGHEQGWQLAEDIRQAFTHMAAVTWAAGTPHEQEILWCEANEPHPVRLDRDENNRPRWSVSFQINAKLEGSWHH